MNSRMRRAERRRVARFAEAHGIEDHGRAWEIMHHNEVLMAEIRQKQRSEAIAQLEMIDRLSREGNRSIGG